MKKDSKSESSANLRQKAEELYNKKLLSSGSRLDDTQTQNLLQNLKVHQIELELQNQEILLAKEQIAANAEKYTELFDFAPLGYFTLSKEGEIVEINLFGSQMLGKERSLLKNSRFGFFVSDDSKTNFNYFLDKVLNSRSKETCEVNLSVNGDVPMIVELIGIANGNREQCLVIATDITQRKQEEAELLEKEVQYYNLANAGIALTWTSGTDKLCNYFNEAWLKFTGRAFEQELGNGWAEGVHPEDLARCLDIYVTAFDRRESFEMEYRLLHVSGEYRWILDIGTPNYNSLGEFIGYIGSCFDITQRKQTEEALSTSEEKFRLLLENSEMGIGIYSLDGRILWYNQVAIRNIGRKAGDIIGKTLYEVFDEPAAAAFMERIQVTAKSDNSIDFEELVELDSGFHWYLTNYSRIKDPDGVIRSVQLIAHDITERKRAEDALRETNELFSLFMMHSPYYTFIKEVSPVESRVLNASQNFKDMIGIPGSEMEGKTMSELFPAELAAKFNADDWNAVSTGKVLKVDEDLNGRNYTTIKYPITLDGKKLLAGYTIDITDQKLAEEKVIKMGQHFQALIENAPDGIVLLDAEGNFRFISPSAKRIFGYQSSEEVAGSPAADTYPADLNMVLSALSDIIKDPSYIPTLQYRYRAKTGSWIWVESTFTNLLDDPSVESILINFRNITEQKLAEEKLFHVTRLYAFLGQVNQAIVRNRHEDELFRKICNVAVEFGQFRMAWIGLTDESSERVKPVAFSGFEDGYLDAIHVTMNDEPSGKGPSGQALKHGSIVICNDISADPRMLSWRDEALRRGYCSSASVPFRRMGQLEGTLNIYSAETDFFTEDQVKLLEEIGANISFALEAMVSEADRRKAVALLRESEEQYRSLFNNFLDSVAVHQIVLDAEGKPADYIFIQANASFETHTGLRVADIHGKRASEVIPGIGESPLIGIYGKVAIEGEPINFEQYFEPLGRYFHISAFQVGQGRFCTVFQDITDTRVAEKALEESETRFRNVFEHSVIGKSMTTIDGKLRINQAFCEMIGYSKDQLAKMDWTSITHPDDVEKDQAIVQSIILGEKAHARWEKRYIHQNGSIVWADISTTLQRDNEGKPLFFNTSVIDITERRNAEELLQKSEERYRSLMTNLEAGVVIHAPDTSIIMNNHKAAELLGLTDDQMKGRQSIDPAWKFIDEKNVTLLPAEYPANRILTTKKPFNNIVFGVVQHETKNTIWLTVNGFPVFDEQGEIAEVLISFIDVSERIKAEIKLKESESKFRNLVWDMQVGVLLQDSKSQILLCNPKALELLGLTEDQLLGKTSFDSDWNVIHEDGSPFPGSAHPVVQAIARNKPVRDVVMGVYRPNKGDRIWLLVDAEPQSDNNGEVQQVVCTFVDITARKQAEEMLVENRDLLANLARLVPGVVYQYRLYPDGRSAFPYASPGMNDIYEVNPEEVLVDATPVFGRLHPGDFDYVVETIQESARTLNTFYCEFRVNLPRQGLRWRWSQAQPLRMEDGSILWHGIISDITDRKLAEQALLVSEQKFRDTVANLDEGYYSAAPDGLLLEYNQAFCRMLGFDNVADLKGAHLTDFWKNAGDRQVYLDLLMDKGSVSNYLVSVKTKTGSKISVLVSAHLIRDNDNRPLRIDGIFLDITERIRIEEALHRHAERLQNLHKIDKAILSLVETPEAIVQKTLQHIRSLLLSQHASIGICDFENETLQLFVVNVGDKSMDEAKKFLISNAFADLEILREKRMDVVEDISIRSLPRDLQMILLAEGIKSCINVPLISGGKLIGVMNLGWKDPRVFTDEELEIASEVADEITIAIEQVRLRQVAKLYTEEMEKMVEKRTSQLTVANKELEAFSYSVSHDLRAPLRHISGYVNILSKHLEGTLPEKEKHYLDTIADSAHQMGVLIDDLLHFSRTGRQAMQLISLDMNVVLRDALKVVQHDSDTNGRKIKWEIAGLPHVYGDYALLRLVWLNLLSNAVKFSRSDVILRIEIGVVDEINEYLFFVRDNGVGFDMQYAQKLFGVFERLHSAQEFEGTGIGLANVRRIIQRHGGRTWAEAEVDKGATFYFSLPKV